MFQAALNEVLDEEENLHNYQKRTHKEKSRNWKEKAVHWKFMRQTAKVAGAELLRSVCLKETEGLNLAARTRTNKAQQR